MPPGLLLDCAHSQEEMNMIPTPSGNVKAAPVRRAVKTARAHGPVVDTNKLDRIKVSSVDDASVRWAASFASCGGRNAEQSSTIVYEIAPGGHLGWHTDATEETQYIIAGTGELCMEDGKFPVGPGSVFVLPTNVRHDLANTGKEPLRAVAFFAAAMFTQDFDNVMLPPKSHILGTPNREGRPRTLLGPLA
jgi:quercetin dioxygenase-like cupin family protein